jgi:hypothetical protein
VRQRRALIRDWAVRGSTASGCGLAAGPRGTSVAGRRASVVGTGIAHDGGRTRAVGNGRAPGGGRIRSTGRRENTGDDDRRKKQRASGEQSTTATRSECTSRPGAEQSAERDQALPHREKSRLEHLDEVGLRWCFRLPVVDPLPRVGFFIGKAGVGQHRVDRCRCPNAPLVVTKPALRISSGLARGRGLRIAIG